MPVPHLRRLAFGTLLLLASILAGVWLAPERQPRIPPGWDWEANFIGTQSLPTEDGRGFDKPLTAVYGRRMRLLDESRRPAAVTIEDVFWIVDLASGRKTWEYVVHSEIDPATGCHRAGDTEERIIFPRNPTRGTYRIRWNYLEGVPMQFQREVDVDGMTTWLFEYHGRGEYTESYVGSPEYPGVPVAPGQEIRCRDDQLLVRAWVEPITGEIVQLEESCDSGDYVYDIATGKAIQPVMIWNGMTEGDDVARRMGRIAGQRSDILQRAWLPRCGAAAGAVLIALAWLRTGRRVGPQAS